MRLLLTKPNLYITNRGSRIVWKIPIYLLGKDISLNSLTLIGPNVSLYGLAYIMRDDGACWSTNFTFESTKQTVKCINNNAYSYRYTYGQREVVFNLQNKNIEPILVALNYDDIHIDLNIR